MITVVVPARNEEAVITRLLRRLSAENADDVARNNNSSIQIIVVCNGCEDRTAEVARRFPGVSVVETPHPSKADALRLADSVADGFPRVYVDADVELDRAAVLTLAAAVTGTGVLAAAPQRLLSRAGMSLPVRWYHDVWEALPSVREGLFGRGVVALSEEGHLRVRGLDQLMSDDLVMSSAFEAGERRVVEEATVVLRGARTWKDLVSRRVRVVTGTRQAYEAYPPGAAPLRTDSRTTVADLAGIVRRRPGLLPKLAVFLAVTVVARRRAARAVAAGDFTTWARDESSRRPDPQ